MQIKRSVILKQIFFLEVSNKIKFPGTKKIERNNPCFVSAYFRMKVNLIYKFWKRKSFLLEDIFINREWAFNFATDDDLSRKWTKNIEVSFLKIGIIS